MYVLSENIVTLSTSSLFAGQRDVDLVTTPSLSDELRHSKPFASLPVTPLRDNRTSLLTKLVTDTVTRARARPSRRHFGRARLADRSITERAHAITTGKAGCDPTAYTPPRAAYLPSVGARHRAAPPKPPDGRLWLPGPSLSPSPVGTPAPDMTKGPPPASPPERAPRAVRLSRC